MSKVIINIPDSYPRVEGFVEVFSPLAGSKLPYMNAYLDRDLLPGDVVEITLVDPFAHIDSVGSIKTSCGEIIPVVNCK